MLDIIRSQSISAALELCEKAVLKSGQTVVVGCSSSEILGYNLGTASRIDVGQAVFAAFHAVFSERGIFLAAQCCEHLNRAIIIERKAVVSSDCHIVNAVPTLTAGGSFAAAAYAGLDNRVCLSEIKADAGLDIGGTLIGMHLKHVAVPLRLENSSIGKAAIIAARTRPPYIGGIRTTYDDSLA